MDVFFHLLPAGCKIPVPLAVPYVGSIDFNYGPFNDHPTRLDFPMSTDGIIISEEGRYEEITSLLQSWGFFGLIATMIDHAGGLPDLEALISRDPEGVQSINMTFAGQVVENWGTRIQKQTGKVDWEAHLEFYVGLLKTVHQNARLLDVTFSEKPVASRQRALVILAIKSCIRAFLRALGSIGVAHSVLFTERFIVNEACEYISPSALLAKEFLTNHGWCPVHAERLIETEEIENVYTAAAVKGHFRPSFNHTNCTSEEGCTASNINSLTFRPSHARRNCPCSMVIPDMQAVQSILRQGQIPVVELRRDQSGKYNLVVKVATATTNYTAISHVWSDGLASPRQNGLFDCQLSKIEDDVQSILERHSRETRPRGIEAFFLKALSRLPEESITIWIDAFCVPCYDPTNAEESDAEESDASKQKAIQLMPPTYAGASQVLVIEKSLEAVNNPTTNNAYKDQAAALNICAWLRFLPWMTRCWTLQEGALAKKLFARCAGLPMEVDMAQLSLTAHGDFVTALEHLLSRDTSQKEDIHKILANICGLDASELSKLPPPSRAQALLRWNAPKFPFSLLLQKLKRAPDNSRNEWWIPSFESRICFADEYRKLVIDKAAPKESVPNRGIGDAIFSRIARVIKERFSWGRSPHDQPASRHATEMVPLEMAVLHDRGVVFEPHSLGHMSIMLNGHCPKNFRIQINERVTWVSLDLDPVSFDNDRSPILERKIWVVLPSYPEVLSAGGLIGRGLCVTQVGGVENISVPESLRQSGHERQWMVTPAIFNSALTCGIVTDLTERELASTPLLESIAISVSHVPDSITTGPRFCLLADVATWPILHDVRSKEDKDSPFEYPLGAIIFGSMYCTALIVLLPFIAMACSDLPEGRSALIWLILPVEAVCFCWLWFCKSLYERKRVHRLWVQSFREDARVNRARGGRLEGLRRCFIEWTYMMWPWRD
jgi:hypothetical protein